MKKLVRQLPFYSILKRPSFWLIVVLFFSAFWRFWRLDFPPSYYFDEVYHVVTAKLMAQNDPRAYEWWHSPPEPETAIDWLHPPLAKLTQAASILLLGNHSYAWRFSSAVFGVGVIFLIYQLAKKIGLGERAAALAAALASLDGLLLTMSRITMNDTHVTFFMLLTLWLYLKWKDKPDFKNTFLVGAGAGFASASKWSGIFVLLPIVVDQLILLLQAKAVSTSWTSKKLKDQITKSFDLLSSVLLLVPLIYLGSYAQMFWQGHDLAHWWELHQQIWYYQTHLEATHPYQSSPWQWIINARPVYSYTESVLPDNNDNPQMLNMYIQGNHLLFWAGLVAVIFYVSEISLRILKLAITTFQLANETKTKIIKQTRTSLSAQKRSFKQLTPLLFILVTYLSFWTPWLLSPRIMFFYHYTPAVPLLCIILASLLVRGWDLGGKLNFFVIAVVLAIAINFGLFIPNWTGRIVTQDFAQQIYFPIKSWR